jgi:membrane protease subunit HflC
MTGKANLSLFALIIVGITAGMSLFIVDEREFAVKLKFGEIVKADYQPGLHAKWPLAESVLKFPDRILTYDSAKEKFLTGEKKNLLVDYYVTYRVVDPTEYYRSTGGQKIIAEERLTAIIKEGIKAEFGRRKVTEVVSAERSEFMAAMLDQARLAARELGVDVVDVRVKRIDLSEEVSDSVFSRMRQERKRVANQLRAEGAREAERVKADAERQRTVILAEAYRTAEETRGEGDARASETYANAFNKNRDFYAFYRSMQAYRTSMGKAQDVLVLKPDSEFFRFLTEQQGTRP